MNRITPSFSNGRLFLGCLAAGFIVYGLSTFTIGALIIGAIAATVLIKSIKKID